MSAAFGPRATWDGYVPELELVSGAPVARFLVTVANAAAYAQFGRGGAPPLWEPGERYLIPGVYTFERRASAVRFRSATPGVPAAIAAEAVDLEEALGDGR